MKQLISFIFVFGLLGCATEPVRTPAAEVEENNETDNSTFLKKVKKKNVVYDKQN